LTCCSQNLIVEKRQKKDVITQNEALDVKINYLLLGSGQLSAFGGFRQDLKFGLGTDPNMLRGTNMAH
jgi:hypothetical protein